jgi:pSer/pThr/pTyr-binding forkhead associated (FHA) protein
MRCILLYKLYWVKDDGYSELLDIGGVLGKYGSVFIGRFTGNDAYEARKCGVIEKSYYSLYIFRPGEFYHYMEVEDGYVSRRHALIELRGDGPYIIDHGPEGRGSTNGTFINGMRIEPGEPYRLNHGDEISLGSQTTLKMVYEGKPLTISGPTELGKNDIEVLKDAGLPMDVGQVPRTMKPLVYIQQVVEKPIKISSGIEVIVVKLTDARFFELAGMVSQAINKVEKREADAKMFVHRMLIELNMISKNIKDILSALDVQEDLKRFEYDKMIITKYVDDHITDERLVKESLCRLQNILWAIGRNIRLIGSFT